VAETARLLIAGGFLRQEPDGGLVPARPPEDITLGQIAQVARTSVVSHPEGLGPDPLSQAVAMAFLQAERAGDEGLSRLTLRALAEPLVAKATEAAAGSS
jgi:DNA-binding IscR family transcriptional regulator